MFAHKRFAFFMAIVIASMLIISNWTTPAQATRASQQGNVTPIPTSTPVDEPVTPGETPSVEQQEELKSVIQSYFDIRYSALSASHQHGFRLDGFGGLVSEEPDAKAFLNAELGKLAVETRYAELNGSRYVDYKYFLDFRNFNLDPATQLVTVSLVEDKEIITENSAKGNPATPLVAQIWGLEHTIVMRKEQDRWKIVSDQYNDFLWRTLRRTGKSTEEILNRLSTKEAPQVSGPSGESAGAEAASLLPDDTSSHAYDRNGAVAYALAHSAQGTYNPDYPSYDNGLHGDCTNLVSQALYEGGNVSMYLPKVGGITVLPPPNEQFQGEEGWYLLWAKQRGRYWNDVGAFYDFVTQSYLNWDEGPEGTVFPAVPIGQWPVGLMVGDVIQYNEEMDAFWEHAVIVVGFDQINGEPIVASHSPNLQQSNFKDVVSYQQMRFIHIERSDGYAPVKAEIQQNLFQSHSSDDAGTFTVLPNTCTFSESANEVYFGTCFGSGASITSGFLFRSIQIPQYARIKYAYLSFTIDGPYSAAVNLQINGEYAANSLPFTSGSPPESRPTTVTSVPWTISDSWSLTDPRERRISPQLSSVVENIVSHPTWASGNALSLIFRNTGSNVRRVFAYERAKNDPSASPAKLIAAYDLTPPTTSLSFPSLASQDGWILESTETSGVGGTINAGATSFTLGDNAADKQYRGILHFNTGALPPNAVITSATLKIKQQGSITGTNPFTTHGNLVVDIRMPYFGTGASLVAADFQAAVSPGVAGVATFNPTPVSGWYTATISSAGFSQINLAGTTQFRLAFTLDDNDDLSVDTILFSSGNNGTAANRPQLIIQYYEDQGLVGTTP